MVYTIISYILKGNKQQIVIGPTSMVLSYRLLSHASRLWKIL